MQQLHGLTLTRSSRRNRRRPTFRALGFAVVIVLLATIGSSSVARATSPWFVDPQGSDSNNCLSAATACRTIGGAILKAAAGDTISIAPGTYAESLNLPFDLSIIGAGASQTSISGLPGSGIISITSQSVTIQLANLTLSGGQSVGSGGAITNYGTLTLTNSIVRDNQAFLGEGYQGVGGGIANFGTLTLSRSTISTNQGITGGAIYNSGMLIVDNSTLSGNKATADGGGIANTSTGKVQLTYVTIAANTADSDGNGTGHGGGIFSGAGSTTAMGSSLLADNFDAGAQAPDCAGTIVSQSNNLIETVAGCTLSGDITGNVLGQAAQLGPLQNNGGPTPTHALLMNSPGIDAANPTVCPTTDQRGVSRPQGAACDIGAYEYDVTPPTVTRVTPAKKAVNVCLCTNVMTTFSEDMSPGSINSSTFLVLGQKLAPVAGTITYDAASRTATFQPTTALVPATLYIGIVKGGRVEPRVKDIAGNPLAHTYIWYFFTGGPSTCASIWSPTAVPTTPSTSDPHAAELGVKFQADVAGFITGIRFYKGSGNTGTHTGTLWSNNGQKLATATFSGETATGWQQVTFATPVPITANTTYIAAYHTDTGNFAEDDNFFAASGVDTGSLHALQNGRDGPNGVFVYGASAFPTQSYQSANYWVDVTFASGN